MAYTEAERVQVRRWLGYPAVYSQSFRGLEDSLDRSLSIAQGGVHTDNSTELAVRGYLANLATIEASWLAYLTQMEVDTADENRIDSLRGLAGVKQIGRMYVGFLADTLDTRPLRDVFMPAVADPQGGAWSRPRFS
ncbi:MAG: hypothetical protein ABI632_12805 [Pseudolysinimonas sp.]